jgi:hypothetical protein
VGDMRLGFVALGVTCPGSAYPLRSALPRTGPSFAPQR